MEKLKLAGCVLLNEQKEVLLIHRNTPNRVQWEIPGGKIEPGENSRTAAKRELKEELDINITIIKKLGKKDFNEDKFVMSYIWYLSTIKSGTIKLMEEKFDDLNYFSWDKLLEIKSSLSPNAQNFVESYFNKDFFIDNK